MVKNQSVLKNLCIAVTLTLHICHSGEQKMYLQYVIVGKLHLQQRIVGVLDIRKVL